MKKYLKTVLFTAMFSTFAMTAFAEEAPVYDVDNYPPQFDGQPDLPMGPQTTPTPPTQKLSSNADVDEQVYAQATPTSLEQRVGRLEQQISNTLRSETPNKVETMQTEMQTLRGQLEELTHQLQQLQTQQKTLYTDLDKRLAPPPTEATEQPAADAVAKPSAKAKATKSKLGKALDAVATPTLAKAATPEPADSQPNPAEEQQIYQNAYSFIKAKKYSQAASTLQKMLQKYPSGQFAANAHYWLGELYGLMGKNDQAATEFGNVVKNYPESPKLADAQLKLGLIYAAEFKWADARSAFKTVMSNYPGTSTARLASEQLKQIKSSGH